MQPRKRGNSWQGARRNLLGALAQLEERMLERTTPEQRVFVSEVRSARAHPASVHERRPARPHPPEGYRPEVRQPEAHHPEVRHGDLPEWERPRQERPSAPQRARTAPPAPAALAPSSTREELMRLVRDHRSHRMAVLLHEVLGPPKGLLP